MKILKILDNVEEIFSSIMIILVILTLFIQISSRYIFGIGQPWTEELLRFSFLGLVYSASSLGVKKRGHFRVTFVIEMLPPIFKKLSDILMYVVWLGMNFVIIYYSILYISNMGKFPQTSQMLQIDMRYIFSLIPIAFTLQSIRLVKNLYEDFFSKQKDNNEESWDEKISKLGN